MVRFVLAAAMAVFFTAGEAQAQPVCSLIKQTEKQLRSEFGETRVVTGVVSATALMVAYANTKTGTWTIVLVSGDGLACRIASGDGWRVVIPEQSL